MHLIPTEIPLPKNESDFERMCADVYGVVFHDPKPKTNGRKGQSQGGVDVFVNAHGIGRIGVQCKKYFRTTLEWKHVEDEVGKADKYKTPIKTLLIATTSPSDASLLHKVQLLSDGREAQGLFSVEVEFWEDIENHINRFTSLQDSYAPHSPGAAYYRQDQKLDRLHELTIESHNTIATLAALPAGRDDSANKFITAQLDRTNELLKASLYQDALAHIAAIGKDLEPFDAHQKARWYLQRGLCLWFNRDDDKDVAGLFLKAASLYPDDERMAAARVRGLMLNENIDDALDAGLSAIERFPDSQQVWLIYINVRALKDEPIQLEDIPSSMRDEPDFLQMFAIAARKRENFAEAVRLSIKAANHKSAGFFTRATALNLVVEDAARNTVAAMYGLLSKNQLDALNRVMELFEPRHEKLWSVQSAAVDVAAAQLGFVCLLRQDPKGAMEIVKEATAHGINSKELLRVHIMALSELNQNDEALELGRTHLAELTRETITIVAELAANCGDVKFLEEIISQTKSWPSDCQEAVDLLTALRWAALARAGEKVRALREIADTKIAENGSFILACNAARLLNHAGYPLEAVELIDRAKSLIGEQSHESDRLMLAELLFYTQRWMEAAALYEQLVPIGQLSKLHTRLLTCYVEADSRKKAKEFLNRLPEGWIENDEIRRLAMHLGQMASDWAFLLPLAETQIRKAPTEAVSWLFKLHVARHCATPAAFQDMVRQVPEELSGSIQNLAQLARLELQYDEALRGLRRLYRLVRQNFDEPEAFSAYFIGIMAAPPDLPLMEDTLPVVAAGSALTLVSDTGHELHVAIDPSDVGTLPKRIHFLRPDTPEAIALLGAKVGQIVAVPAQAFGGTQNFSVKTIQSAYRHLLQVTQERALALGGLPNMKLVQVGTTGDAVKDLSFVHDELKRSSETNRQLFENYGNGRLTISRLAKMLGRSPIENVIGWPSDAPPIFIGTGLVQEKDEALAVLARADVVYVTDVLTLAELVNFGAQDVLAALPKVYISPVTMGAVEDFLHDSEGGNKAIGSAIDNDGQLAFIGYDDKFRERRITFAKELVNVAKKYCTVQPAYSELTPPVEIPRFVEILNEEEREMFLLAKECNATLLTLDGRLRMLAKFGTGVNGVWPQALIMHSLATGQITPVMSTEFTINQFLANRKFISLSSGDLVWMVMQGDSYIQRGIQAFKQYLESTETDLTSSSIVAFEFLESISQLNIQLGAFGELFVHIIEPIFRRKDCLPDFHENVKEFVRNLPEELAGKPYLYPPANWFREQRIRMQWEYLTEKLIEARERSNGPIEVRPIAVRVLYCCKIPHLILDKNILEKVLDESLPVGDKQDLSANPM